MLMLIYRFVYVYMYVYTSLHIYRNKTYEDMYKNVYMCIHTYMYQSICLNRSI